MSASFTEAGISADCTHARTTSGEMAAGLTDRCGRWVTSQSHWEAWLRCFSLQGIGLSVSVILRGINNTCICSGKQRGCHTHTHTHTHSPTHAVARTQVHKHTRTDTHTHTHTQSPPSVLINTHSYKQPGVSCVSQSGWVTPAAGSLTQLQYFSSALPCLSSPPQQSHLILGQLPTYSSLKPSGMEGNLSGWFIECLLQCWKDTSMAHFGLHMIDERTLDTAMFNKKTVKTTCALF